MNKTDLRRAKARSASSTPPHEPSSKWPHQRKTLRATLHSPTTLESFAEQQRQNLQQDFRIHTESPTVIRGKGGMTFHLPAAAFLDRQRRPVRGLVEISIIELTRQADTVLTGRPTTSMGRLLETGGAFKFEARQDGAPVFLDRPIQATVPVGPLVRRPAQMQRYDGISAGPVFDWIASPVRGGGVVVDSIEDTFQVRIPQPGWINCDHAYWLRQQTRYEIRIEVDSPPLELDVYFLYRTVNTTAKLWESEAGTYTLPDPAPLPAVVYALGATGRQFYQGFHLFDQDPRQPTPPSAHNRLKLNLQVDPVESSSIKTTLERKIREWDCMVMGLLVPESLV